MKNHFERCRAQRKGGGDEDKTIKTGDFATTVVIKGKCRIDQINHSIDAEGFTTEHCDPSILNPIKVEIHQTYLFMCSVYSSLIAFKFAVFCVLK